MINYDQSQYYTIPFKAYSKPAIWLHTLCIAEIVFFLSPLFLFYKELDNVFIGIGYCLLVLFFSYMWIYVGILKRAYFKLDEKGVFLKTVFYQKSVDWADIESITKGWDMIGITTKEKEQKKRENVIAKLMSFLGDEFSLRIPLSLFSNINGEKMMNTIVLMIKKSMEREAL